MDNATIIIHGVTVTFNYPLKFNSVFSLLHGSLIGLDVPDFNMESFNIRINFKTINGDIHRSWIESTSAIGTRVIALGY